MNPQFTICVMADFGLGPYAWLRDSDVPRPKVGRNEHKNNSECCIFDVGLSENS